MSNEFSFKMSNDELEAAIAMAFSMVGRTTRDDSRHVAAMEHFKKLLEVQLGRAHQIETRHEGDPLSREYFAQKMALGELGRSTP